MFVGFIAPVRTYLDKGHWTAQSADKVSLEGLEARHEEMSKLVWPQAREARSDFEAAAMEEFRLATRLEMAGCRSAAMIHLARKGQSIPKTLVRQFVHEAGVVIPELKRVWMLRNRPSRLCDNLAGIRRAMREYPKLQPRA